MSLPTEAEARELLAALGYLHPLPSQRMAKRRCRPAARRCALYRHFDAAGVLLYVGVTADTETRGGQHASSSAWVEYAANGTVEWYDSPDEARDAERLAIRTEMPIFNQRHAATGSGDRLRAYLTTRGVRVDQYPSMSTEVRHGA